MQAELRVVERAGTFPLRINSEWTPNYYFGENEDGENENRDGLYVLQPGKQMKHVEVWDKATDGASVKELFQTKLGLYDCDYLVVLGCKSGSRHHTHAATGEHTVKRVLRDMAQHPHHARLQAWGCAKLGSLTHYHLQFIVDQGGIEAIVAALHALPLSTTVAKAAFEALLYFSANADVRSHIVEVGGIEAILKTLRKTPHVHDGCNVLTNLAVNNHTNAYLIATAAGEEVFSTCEKFHWRPYHFTVTWRVLRWMAIGIIAIIGDIFILVVFAMGFIGWQGRVKRKRKKRRAVTNTNTHANKFSPRQTRSQTRRTRSQTRQYRARRNQTELRASKDTSARAKQVSRRRTGSLQRRNRSRKRARTQSDRRPSKRPRPMKTA